MRTPREISDILADVRETANSYKDSADELIPVIFRKVDAAVKAGYLKKSAYLDFSFYGVCKTFVYEKKRRKAVNTFFNWLETKVNRFFEMEDQDLFFAEATEECQTFLESLEKDNGFLSGMIFSGLNSIDTINLDFFLKRKTETDRKDDRTADKAEMRKETVTDLSAVMDADGFRSIGENDEVPFEEDYYSKPAVTVSEPEEAPDEADPAPASGESVPYYFEEHIKMEDPTIYKAEFVCLSEPIQNEEDPNLFCINAERKEDDGWTRGRIWFYFSVPEIVDKYAERKTDILTSSKVYIEQGKLKRVILKYNQFPLEETDTECDWVFRG